MERKMKISELCEVFNLAYIGENHLINGLNLCNRKSVHKQILTYVTNEDYVEQIRANNAVVAVLLPKEYLMHYQILVSDKRITLIACDEPENMFYNIHEYLYYKTDFYEKFNFPSKQGEGCEIHPSAVIECGVILGNYVKIGPNSVIKRGTIIQDRCVIGCNSTIGSEGFQIIKINGKNRKIIHCGGVLIQEEVCIGDNVTVGNSLFENTTYIGKGTMIDNHTYIAHNVQIGENATITAGTVLCGSVIVEDGAWIGVNSSILNRVTIGSYSKVGMGSVVTRDIPVDSLAYGVPARVK